LVFSTVATLSTRISARPYPGHESASAIPEPITPKSFAFFAFSGAPAPPTQTNEMKGVHHAKLNVEHVEKRTTAGAIPLLKLRGSNL